MNGNAWAWEIDSFVCNWVTSVIKIQVLKGIIYLVRTQNFTNVCVSGGKKSYFLGKFCAYTN